MKKTLVIFLVAVLLAVLLIPVPSIYKDGGTRTYTSLTYKVIVWNTLEGKRGTEVHLFPNNFYSLDDYHR